MVLRGFDKEIGGIGKTCRCVMGKRAVQEKEGYLPQRQVCGLPAGARVFLWINAGARQSQPAETKNVPAQKPPQEVRFFIEAAPVTALFRYRGIAKEGVAAASLAAKIPASRGNHSNPPPQDVQVRLLGQAHRKESSEAKKALIP